WFLVNESHLRNIMRRFYAPDVQKPPQRLSFSRQTPGKRPSLVLTKDVLVHERVETCIPGPPLSHRWPLCTPMTQPLKLGVYACATARNTRLYMLREPLGRADPMCQATLL